MSDTPKGRGLRPEQWVEVRRGYEAGESVLSLSKCYKVRRQTISERAKREQWTVQITAQLNGEAAKAARDRAQSNVIDIATRRAVERAEETGVVGEIVETIAAELVATSTAGKLAAEYMTDILTKAKNGEIMPASSPGEQTKADVAKTVMMAYRTFQATIRENHGLRPGVPSIPKEHDDGKPSIIELVVVDGPQEAEAS